MNLADLPTAVMPDPAAFEQVLRQGLGRWMVGVVDAAIRRQEPAASNHGGSSTPLPGPLLRQRRVALVQALAGALAAQLDARASAAPVAARPADGVTDGITDRSADLTLISETQIDDEIETARIVQLIEAGAERELHELARLCSRLQARSRTDLATVPLGPLACARAVRQAADEVAPDAAQRTALLRGLGAAMAEQLREVYAELAHWLGERGVEPVGARRRDGHEPPPAPDAGWAAPLADQARVGDETPTPPAESMRELVAWAHRTQAAPLDDAAEPALTLRLDARPAPAPGERPLPRAAAEELMERLFAELRQQTAQSASMVGLLQRLEQLARRLAADDPQVWSHPGHPGWQLLDRLLAATAVHDDLGAQDQRVLGRSLDALLHRLLGRSPLDASACQRAADDVQQLTFALLAHAAAPAADTLAELQREADRDEVERAFRSQILQQLRTTPTCGLLRRFLVGPWTMVLTALALRHGADSEPVGAAALVVDDLIRATAQPGQKVSRALRAVLLRQVGRGLAVTDLPRPRIDAELVELAEILRDPPPLSTDAATAWPDEPSGPPPEPVMLDLHAGLPTVPMAGSAVDPLGLPPATPAQWAASLQAGALCRLFLQGRWMTARLKWVGPDQRLFLFQSRHGGRTHTLTQRMLCKLREAGLATRIDDNLLRAQAMESLVRNTVL